MDSNEHAHRAAQLEATIRAAFPIVPIPYGHRRADGIKNYEVDNDVKKFANRMWTEIPLEYWIKSISPAAIRSATSNEFFRYYSPSLLVAVLQDSDYTHLALDALLPDNPKYEPRSEWKTFCASFSPQQAEAIVSFLELVKEGSTPGSAEQYGAEAGLGGLWN
ncbi:DUF6714 family protein [Cupriavidus agavae]|uniref:DUF6714 family protein n=1 Tax=Cupriavidus agavae TaxID=1001822 RepID=UPI00102CF22B|nr:DUF6714 family protein [Cupriavidus agavae]